MSDCPPAVIRDAPLAARILAVRTVPFWPCVGIITLVFEGYVLGTWIAGPYFAPTDPGSDALPHFTHIAGTLAQALTTVLGAIFLYRALAPTLLRRDAWNTQTFLVVSWCLMWFWDPMMNYTSTHILYNSHLVNFGSWTLGSTPGWISPNGNLLPEPLLIVIPGYPLLCLGSVLLTRRILQPYEGRFSKVQILCAGFLVLAVADTLIELALVRTGLYVFPGGIRRVTLFAGQKTQFPLTEALFCALAWSASLTLLLWRDQNGLSFVERGLNRPSLSAASRTAGRFLAVFGWAHLMVFALWVVPNQWLALHSDPYPAGYPSYLINHMCVYGVERDQCPGPGVMIPRPD